jgi:antirestriction protein ArdC
MPTITKSKTKSTASKQSKPKKEAIDKFELVTDKIIQLMEAGVKPWVKPWSTPSCATRNLVTGHIYRGINPILCGVDILLNGYTTPCFVGFFQAKSMNWQVKKGSKSTWILWGGTSSKIETNNETGEETTRFFSTAKWYNVFNTDCLDDSDSDHKIAAYLEKYQPSQSLNTSNRNKAIDDFIAAQNAVITYQGDRAFYVPAQDIIQLPEWQYFFSGNAFAATAIHELAHWTGHESRLDRKLTSEHSRQAYAYEELIAELGSAMVCSQFGIESELVNHASYLDYWLSALKSDKKIFFKAAKQASRAANYLLRNAGLLPTEEEESQDSR